MLSLLCCLAGATIPLYTYARRYCSKPKRTRSFGDLHTVPDIDAPSSGSDSDNEQEKSFLDQLLVAQVRPLPPFMMPASEARRWDLLDKGGRPLGKIWSGVCSGLCSKKPLFLNVTCTNNLLWQQCPGGPGLWILSVVHCQLSLLGQLVQLWC